MQIFDPFIEQNWVKLHCAIFPQKIYYFLQFCKNVEPEYCANYSASQKIDSSPFRWYSIEKSLSISMDVLRLSRFHHESKNWGNNIFFLLFAECFSRFEGSRTRMVFIISTIFIFEPMHGYNSHFTRDCFFTISTRFNINSCVTNILNY